MSLESLPMQPEPEIPEWQDVPEQRGPGIPTLPRGTYEFQLPYNLTPDRWKEDKDKNEVMHFRLSFDADFPLVVTATNVQGVEEHALFRGSISTRPRPRFVGKRGDPPKYVSDAVYLYKDALKGPQINIKDDKTVRDGICKVGAGKKFVATVVWPAFCNPKKVRYILDADGNSIEDPEGKQGCGANYRDGKTIDPATGMISERFVCAGKDGNGCGAAIRVFPELSNFRPAIEVPAAQ